MSAAWFDGPDLTARDEIAFFEALVAAAEAGRFGDVRPEDTGRGAVPEGDGDGVVVGLVLPGVTCRRRLLRITYEVAGADVPARLRSDRALGLDDTRDCSTPFDGVPGDTDLWVSGVLADPAAHAGWAAGWFVRELARPVVRREWDRPADGPGSSPWAGPRRAVAVEWHVRRPDELLAWQGTFGRGRLTRQPPSREVHERP